ncbi:MAG: hypothetical protein B7C24_15760 [Bacteroidetes bacterium 4572_77]|nr:MAG: hypothetical protein B7C24_15760 [Bacteroidetes bacterium 4572_77]
MEKISYDHKNYNKIRNAVSTKLDTDFNQIQLDVVEKYYDYMLFEYIPAPSFKILCDEWLDNSSEL